MDKVELSREELLSELFEATVDADRQATALQMDGRQMSYGDLEDSANRLAHHLRARGVGRGTAVAMLLPRSMDVYVALLGILKAGAAYVPLDPDYPADRVEFILSDCAAPVLLTTKSLAYKAGVFAGQVIQLDPDWPEISRCPVSRLRAAETETTWRDRCYIIYTSGTTGRPKGVEIEHRSACHLVRAEGQIFGVHREDRVYQGFSIAFDASVEEVWLAFFAGATLVVGTSEMVRAGAALPRLLTEAGVTVLSCVPTLLAMMEEDIPTLRVLILGGEQCTANLVKRWWRPDRRMVNTYGPTEATVIATYVDCHPDRPVTIGRALPNYSTVVVTEALKLAPAGTPGELLIGGVGLARGYLGRPELTGEKFISNPFTNGEESPSRLYRTGDLVRLTPDGEIEFLGRIDTQVKIRGFRVELSEIEAVLMESPDLQGAAVILREDLPGVQQLVGYVVPRVKDAAFDEDRLRAMIRSRLPAYMVPAIIETLTEFPTLASGKVDRKRLPPPRARAAANRTDTIAPRTDLERTIAETWSRLFAPQSVSVCDDFFMDLGGHSLLAARMVSELRKSPRLREISMLDVYEQPTVERLAAKFENETGPDCAPPNAPSPPHHQPSTAAYVRCGLLQFLSLYFVLGFFALQWLAPYVTYTWLIDEEYETAEAILGALGILIGLYPLMLIVAIASKWLIIGKYKPGRHPMWGFYYFRWWLANAIESTVPTDYLAGTPLLGIYMRLMGAKIGQNVYLGNNGFGAYDLLSIGDDVCIGSDTAITGCTVENGFLHIGAVRIGSRCFVGTRCVIREDCVMEDDSQLDDLSLLPKGTVIRTREKWLGSPARRTGIVGERELAKGRAARPGIPTRLGFGILYGLGLLVFPVVVIAAIFPGMMLMNELNYLDDYYWYLFTAPLVALSFIVILCLEIAAIKWILLGRIKPGRYPLHSFFHFRKWYVDQTMALSLDVIGPLYASIFLPPWYRLLGAKLGERAEISTASFISPDLLSVGDESFIADAVSFGAARVQDGWVTVAGNRIGNRSFIGNSAMLPPGAVIGNNSLIGCLSTPPADPVEALRDNATWMGSPAIFLPQRQQATGFSEETTFKPTNWLRAQRAAIEFVRVVAPTTCFIILTSLLLSVLVLIDDYLEPWQILVLFPVLYAGCGLIATLFMVAMKWALVGRYRPAEKPLWCTFVWRNELVNALHEHLANLFLVGSLTGTPFICWFFRLLGAKVGRRVYMETTELTEYDLVTIGDDVALNSDATLQTHLFEDRVMKMSTVEVGSHCTVGSLSLVLYDTRMEERSALGDLSLLMKGEILPAGTAWAGIPAQRAARDQRDGNPAALTDQAPDLIIRST